MSDVDLSKGHMQRPGDIDKFKEGWDRIFGKKDTLLKPSPAELPTESLKEFLDDAQRHNEAEQGV